MRAEHGEGLAAARGAIGQDGAVVAREHFTHQGPAWNGELISLIKKL